MPNTLTIDFTQPCVPPPVGGYRVSYRPVGDSGPYRVWPTDFPTLPIVFTDMLDPDGTPMEGYVETVCADGLGDAIPFGEAGESESGGGGGESEVPCDGSPGIVVVTNHLEAGTILSVTGIAGFSNIPPNLLPGFSRSGTHTAFAGVISFTLSGSGVNGNVILFKNELLVQCMNIFGAGPYYFDEETFESCDTILLIFTPGECD